MHGSPPVEHRPDCTGVPRSGERRRTVPSGEEGWRGALGTVASVGGWVHTATYLCNGTRTAAGESGEDHARHRRLCSGDDGRSRRDPRNTGAHDDARAGASRDGDDCAGVDNRTAAGCKGIRTGSLDANTSFMYDNSAHSHMNDAVKPGFTYLCCESRASCNTVHLTILTRLRKSTRRVRPRRRGRKL